MKMFKNKSKHVIQLLGVSVYDQLKGRMAIIMQYGGDRLDNFLEKISGNKKNLDSKERREILEDLLLKIAIGIRDIHKENIMHRDIKEANIFVEKTSEGKFIPRIADFGTAQDVEQLKSFDKTQLSEMLTTMRMAKNAKIFYMAPEIDGDQPYDAKIDCFAWAKMAVNCHKLCGLISTTYVNKIKSPEISAALLTVIRDCLEEDPQDRLCAEEIVQRLEDEENDGSTAVHKNFRNRKWDRLKTYFDSNLTLGKSYPVTKEDAKNESHQIIEFLDYKSFNWPEDHAGFNPFDQYLLAGFYPILKEFSENHKEKLIKDSKEEWFHDQKMSVTEKSGLELDLLLDVVFPLIRVSDEDSKVHDRLHNDCNLNQYMKRIQQHYDKLISPIYTEETIREIVGKLIYDERNFGTVLSATFDGGNSLIQLSLTNDPGRFEELSEQVCSLDSWNESVPSNKKTGKLFQINGLDDVGKTDYDFRQYYSKKSHEELKELITFMDKKFYRESENIDWLPLVIPDTEIIQKFQKITGKNQIQRKHIMAFKQETKIVELEIDNNKVWDINQNYQKLLDEIEEMVKPYAKKLIFSKYKEVGKAELKKEIVDTKKVQKEIIGVDLFSKEKGIQIWKPSRFYNPEKNEYVKFESTQNDAWDLKTRKERDEKKRFYEKIEKVVVERMKVFFAMVLLVRSENNKNEMNYFYLANLKRYFKKKLESKIFTFDQEANMDDKWNFFMTELVYKIKKYLEEKEQTGRSDDSELVDLPFESLYFDDDTFVKMVNAGEARAPKEQEEIDFDGIDMSDDDDDMMAEDDDIF